MKKPKTTLWIPPTVLSELMFYTWEVDAEVGGLGRVSLDKEKNDIVLEEIYLLEQTVHETECNLSAEGIAKFYDSLIEEGNADTIGDITLWWHSHKDIPARFSPQDDETMRTWPGNYLVSLVINREMKMDAMFMSKNPLLVLGDIDVHIDWFDIDFADVLRQQVKSKVTKQELKLPKYAQAKQLKWAEDARTYWGQSIPNTQIHKMSDDEWEEHERKEIESWLEDSENNLTLEEIEEVRQEWL
jgi:proteasome lid subunit RPN8/RPN11